jgi:hypothetical protein
MSVAALVLAPALMLAHALFWSVPAEAMFRRGKDVGFSFTAGASGGYFAGPKIKAGSLTLEFTFGLSLGWIAVGLRTAHAPDSSYFMPYGEAGIWFYFVTLGMGYTGGFTHGDGTPVPRHNAHLYLGATIPLGSKAPLLVVPYYRPSWGRGNGNRGFFHEVGVFLKFYYFKLK